MRINNEAAVKRKSKRETKQATGQTFVHGALVLTIGMAMVKVIGALFKVPLKEVIGEYGMGLFSVAYNFYVPIHSLSTAGLPIAISRLVAESYSRKRYRDIKAIKTAAVPIFIVLGVIGTGAMLFGAPYYCNNIIGNRHAVLPMLMLAPAVLFGCLCSIYRGYNEGLKNMYPTAISEIIEAISKLLIGLAASVAVTKYCENEFERYGTVFGEFVNTADDAALMTLSYAAAGAILGVTAGSLFAFLFMFIRSKLKGDGITKAMLQESPKPHNKKSVAKRLIRTAIPVAIGSVTISVAGLIDTTFLQNRVADAMAIAPEVIISIYKGSIPDSYLKSPETVPNFLFGCYTLATTVYMLVPTITQAISISALPNITSLWAKGDKGKLKVGMESVIKMAALFAFPAGFGISAISVCISVLLYGTDPSSTIIADVLVPLGIAGAFSALTTPISSMLQAIGRADIPVKLLLIGMGIKAVLNYILPGIPEINIMGAAIGTLCCYLFLVIGEIICLCKAAGIKLDLSDAILKPFFAAVFCAASAYATMGFMIKVIGIAGRTEALLISLISIIMAAAIFIISLIILGGIKKSDIMSLIKGKKF